MSSPTSVPSEFLKLVRDALSRLYDCAALQDHPLCSILLDGTSSDAVSSAQALRRAILDRLDLLRPEKHIPYSSREWRPYRVLFLRYVQRMPTQAVLDEMAISDRQYQREHARGLKAISGLLWERASQEDTPKAAEAANAGNGSDDVRRLIAGAKREELSGLELLRGAVDDMSRLADEKGVSICIAPDAQDAPIYGDRGLLRQILLNALSYVLSSVQGGSCVLAARSVGEELEITLECDSLSIAPPNTTDVVPRRLNLSRQLTESIGGRMWLNEWSIHVGLPLRRRVLLIVDDNEDVLEMLQRFLADGNVKVIGTTDASEALPLAISTQPFLIMLDVMMPTHDGWEVLQSLKHGPETYAIPVAICSILNEPELAMSLGADDYVRKPVTQTQILDLIGRWTAPRQAR